VTHGAQVPCLQKPTIGPSIHAIPSSLFTPSTQLVVPSLQDPYLQGLLQSRAVLVQVPLVVLQALFSVQNRPSLQVKQAMPLLPHWVRVSLAKGMQAVPLQQPAQFPPWIQVQLPLLQFCPEEQAEQDAPLVPHLLTV